MLPVSKLPSNQGDADSAAEDAWGMFLYATKDSPMLLQGNA